MIQRAQAGAVADESLAVVMEPTGQAWLPVAVYLQRQAITTYLVNSQQWRGYCAAFAQLASRYYSRLLRFNRLTRL